MRKHTLYEEYSRSYIFYPQILQGLGEGCTESADSREFPLLRGNRIGFILFDGYKMLEYGVATVSRID